MKIKILGPVLLLTLATQFARAIESAEGNNNNAILDANLAAAPAASVAEQAVALNSQEAGEALEFAVDELVEAAAKAFKNEEDENVDEDEEDTEVADADEKPDDGEDDDEDEDENDEDEDENDVTLGEDQDQDEALVLEGDDFHYADPLTATYDAQTAQCKQSQHHQEQQQQEQQQEQQTITIQKRDQTHVQLIDEPTLSALATAEVGGACIDSFVNFALRLRERCTIKCLKTFTHVFSNPNVLGILDCFGCSSFFVSGFYALGVDCAGLFAAYPKPPNATVPKTTMTATPTATGTAKAGVTTFTRLVSTKTDAASTSPTATKDTKSVDGPEIVPAGAEDYRLGPVKPEDSALPPIDLASMLKNLGQLSSGDVQDWFSIGSDLAKIVGNGAGSGQNGRNEGEEDSGSEMNKEMDEAKAAAGKDLFNKFVSKAASFANWTLTPEMLDQTGVFDRVQSLGLL